jgi:hypothetical protein
VRPWLAYGPGGLETGDGFGPDSILRLTALGAYRGTYGLQFAAFDPLDHPFGGDREILGDLRGRQICPCRKAPVSVLD